MIADSVLFPSTFLKITAEFSACNVILRTGDVGKIPLSTRDFTAHSPISQDISRPPLTIVARAAKIKRLCLTRDLEIEKCLIHLLEARR